MALCVSVVQADDFVIATGSEGGGYEKVGHLVRQSIEKQADRHKVRFDFGILNTNGSLENLDLFNAGEVQAALVQADALNLKSPVIPFKGKDFYKDKDQI